jgi:sodium-dependent dicarboxylate transporter 2/3/5
MLITCWAILCFLVYPNKMGNIAGAGSEIDSRYEALGKISYNEIMVLIVFVSTAALLIFKDVILPFDIKDAGIAVAAAVALFLIPREDKQGFIMQWRGHGAQNDMTKMPWNILLLFGGGLSIAAAMDQSGLVNVIGNEISSFSSMGVFGIVILCFITTLFITEVMSNLALITIFLPVLAGIAMNFEQNPLLFVIGATLASSCAFMLPMATPPNAIVFASGYIRISQMVRVGVVMNIVSILFITILSYTLASYVFGIKADTIPDWAIKAVQAVP